MVTTSENSHNETLANTNNQSTQQRGKKEGTKREDQSRSLKDKIQNRSQKGQRNKSCSKDLTRSIFERERDRKYERALSLEEFPMIVRFKQIWLEFFAKLLTPLVQRKHVKQSTEGHLCSLLTMQCEHIGEKIGTTNDVT